MNAFLELRNSIKQGTGGGVGSIHNLSTFNALNSPAKSNNGDVIATQREREETLLREKQSLEQTLMNLTEEVESLSKRNEEFLKELKARHDFYGPY